ncbi:MAG: MoaD/ThiS family protein [Spirochaetales bacterium]|nr:MoaD/ThiS family protein [Spirochaetales bacterium]
MKTYSISIRYFAQLREWAGKEEEKMTGPYSTTLGWYEHCFKRYGFGLEPALVRPAVNGKYVSWAYGLRDGDILAFIPPVAGG